MDVLYTTEVKFSMDVTSFYYGKLTDINQFTILNRDLFPSLKFVKDQSLIKILHEIKVNHPCLTVYLDEYLPFNTKHVVLLPGIK